MVRSLRSPPLCLSAKDHLPPPSGLPQAEDKSFYLEKVMGDSEMDSIYKQTGIVEICEVETN